MADSNTTTKLIDLDNLSTYHSLMDAKKEEHSIILTLAQYNALTPEEKMNGKTYYISDAGSSGMVITASDVLMTGYSKASSASAITTNDTGSIAFGKLEKGLEDTNSDVNDIEALIPSNATTSNKLATAADIPGVATASTVGLVKPDGTTITVDANGTITASADLTNYIQKSQTTGLVKNDGTIDRNKYAKIDLYFVPKVWNGYTNIAGNQIWADGDNFYYSSGNKQYVLDKATSTWNTKTWNVNIQYGDDVWTDGTNIYYSNKFGNNNYQYVLDKTNGTWSTKSWNIDIIDGWYIWKDGANIYYSYNNNHYVLDVANGTWSEKVWNGHTDFRGDYIWTDGTDIYYSAYNSAGGAQYVLDRATDTWLDKTWNNKPSDMGGSSFWTDGTNTYYSSGGNSYILDKASSTWYPKTWNSTPTNFNGNHIWTDGENIYSSNMLGNNYIINKNQIVNSDGSLVAPIIVSSTTDLTDGVSPLATDTIYLVYEV